MKLGSVSVTFSLFLFVVLIYANKLNAQTRKQLYCIDKNNLEILGNNLYGTRKSPYTNILDDYAHDNGQQKFHLNANGTGMMIESIQPGVAVRGEHSFKWWLLTDKDGVYVSADGDDYLFLTLAIYIKYSDSENTYELKIARNGVMQIYNSYKDATGDFDKDRICKPAISK